MTYDEARLYLEEIAQSGIVLGLEEMYELLARLGNPQEQLRFVHIAGTNGKGSTVSFISNILEAAGYRVGRYVSPRVFEYEEFVQVNRQNITKSAIARYMGKIKTAIDGMVADGLKKPSLFEVETALGFMHFLEAECDVVVLECGMGGADDATNVVNNVLCNILTPIGFDHMGFLGNSLEEITAVKAGIIKNAAPVCVGKQQKRSFAVIEDACNKMGAPLITTDDSRLKVYDEMVFAEDGAPMIRFDYKYINDIRIRMIGRYQIQNACLAIEAAKALDDWGLNVSVEHIKAGLAQATWSGRFETVAMEPQVIMDGAHNPHGVEQLKQSLEYYFSGKRMIGIMGVLADKAFDEECEMIAPLFEEFYTITPPENPRALTSDKLAETMKQFHNKVTACETIQEAVDAAYADANKEDVIIIFGSLSTMAACKKAVDTALAKRI